MRHCGIFWFISRIWYFTHKGVYLRKRCCCLVAKLCLTLATAWTVAHQGPLSIGFPRQEYWSRLPFLQGIFLIQGLDPCLLYWQADSLALSHLRSPKKRWWYLYFIKKKKLFFKLCQLRLFYSKTHIGKWFNYLLITRVSTANKICWIFCHKCSFLGMKMSFFIGWTWDSGIWATTETWTEARRFLGTITWWRPRVLFQGTPDFLPCLLESLFFHVW